MITPTVHRVWRRRLIGLRSLLVLCLALALLTLRRAAPDTPAPLEPLLWLAALLLPNLLALFTLSVSATGQRRLLGLELLLDTLLFTAVLQQLGGASNPLSFYLLVPMLLAALTLRRAGALTLLIAALAGYLLVAAWHTMPAPDSTLHALTRELSHTHGVGMGVVFVALALLLCGLGQVIQTLSREQQRQQERLLELGGRRERLYDVAATLAHQAHELNTPLSSLVMLVEDALQEPGLPPAAREDLRQIDTLARHIAGRLRHSEQRGVADNPDFATLVTGVQRHLRHLHPTLSVTREGDDEQRFEQGPEWFRVLINLGYNAIDAGADRLHLQLTRDRHTCVLVVNDDGPGHDQKSSREGLGIGLALVESTLADLHARLELRFERQWSQARIHWRDAEQP